LWACAFRVALVHGDGFGGWSLATNMDCIPAAERLAVEANASKPHGGVTSTSSAGAANVTVSADCGHGMAGSISPEFFGLGLFAMVAWGPH